MKIETISQAVATPAGSLPAIAQLSAADILTPPSRQNARLGARLGAFALDAALLTLAFVLASFIRFDAPLHGQTINMLQVVLPIYLIIALNVGAFELPAVVAGRTGSMRAIRALVLTIGAVLLTVFLMKASAHFSRIAFATGSGAAFLMVPAGRFALARLMRHILGSSPFTEVLVVDDASITPRAHDHVINAAAAGIRPEVTNPEMMNRLGAMLKNADQVYIACKPEARADWVQVIKGLDADAHLIVNELDDLGPLGIGEFNGNCTVQVGVGRMALADRVMKRLLDLVVATIGLIVLAPVMVVTALLIRLDSPGPVLFIQNRVGLGNRHFAMFKFRSMRSDKLDATGDRSASRDDDRVTRIGAFIRKTSIDELPQIFNVLNGTMSVVGPRPHALGSQAEERYFWEIDNRYWDRHAMKPGLTGLAQIRGFRGATHVESDLTNRLQADLEYLSGWSIWKDVMIILSTFRVLVHRNAF